MIARLWWKETRQAWPIWAFLTAGGLALQASVGWYWGDEAGPGGYVAIALVVTLMYLFLIAAAIFAGERENGTLSMLDAIPIERWRVWAAKSTFALATTAALGLVLWLGARVFGGWSSEWSKGGAVTVVWGLNGLGWGLFWSSILGNALVAAILAMAFLSISLLSLVDLNPGPANLESAPSLLIVAGLATAASAVIFQRGGPPRRASSRARPSRLATVAATATAVVAREPRPPRIWRSVAPRLAWQTLGGVRAELWTLFVLGVVGPMLLAMNTTQSDLNLIVGICLGVVAILTGVAVFNGENRGCTHRFLLQHGARPGVVWGVKVLIWWGVAVGLWMAGSLPIWLSIRAQPIAFNAGVPAVMSWATSGLTIGFAAAVLCGMVFRRGIMAGMIALVVCLLIYIPLGALFAAQVFFPWHLPYLAAALLAVSWAWSGDWLLDRPGVGRWVRLALYSIAVPAVLIPFYIASRTWTVPTLPSGTAESLFQTSRIAAPVPDDQNAAPLYHEAQLQLGGDSQPILEDGKAPEWWSGSWSFVSGDLDAHDPALAAWLGRIEPALATLRKASRMPSCRFGELSKATEFRPSPEPAPYSLMTPVVVSARVRQARGDLEGAWTEVETLLRMARQFSFTPSWSYSLFEPAGLGLAMRWAGDPRQTADSLERGLRAWRDLPPAAKKADRVRIDAVVFRNTLATPRADLVDGLFFGWAAGGRKKVQPLERLRYDLQTTPWEIERARKVFALLAAARIQEIETRPSELATSPQPWTPRLAFNWDEGAGRVRSISADELEFLSQTTSLARYSRLWQGLSSFDRDETARRALNQIFLLRIWQARHEGKLPQSLLELRSSRPDLDGEPFRGDGVAELDLYTSKPFGYIPSQGQHLLPLGSYEPIGPDRVSFERLRSTADCWLLYSVGPDAIDDRAMRNLDYSGQGDIIFPLKDGVKPPEPAAP
ncbi:ABC transporter permease [Planctomyces sp. SH-PL62]|uniref:ABC transporter permease n=1 Tax=Planctomyces sp. SH-PL62 TaxID=1636152 RepID=UPI00078E66F6|nr:ABC transporter permease [Planctomyces sp. SH-PL62]AMV36408.1 ABC-2 family transporter protein [Planctomyces sp. SH-PL62]